MDNSYYEWACDRFKHDGRFIKADEGVVSPVMGNEGPVSVGVVMPVEVPQEGSESLLGGWTIEIFKQ